MPFSQEQGQALFTAIQSGGQKLGVFDQVVTHEPKSAPQGLPALAVWLAPVTPLGTASGLGATSGRISLAGRIYIPDTTKPEDVVDAKLLGLISALFGWVTGGFTLIDPVTSQPLVMEVDLLGHFGEPLAAVPGYLEQDGKFFRVANLTIPLIVSDLWQQVA